MLTIVLLGCMECGPTGFRRIVSTSWLGQTESCFEPLSVSILSCAFIVITSASSPRHEEQFRPCVSRNQQSTISLLLMCESLHLLFEQALFSSALFGRLATVQHGLFSIVLLILLLQALPLVEQASALGFKECKISGMPSNWILRCWIFVLAGFIASTCFIISHSGILVGAILFVCARGFRRGLHASQVLAESIQVADSPKCAAVAGISGVVMILFVRVLEAIVFDNSQRSAIEQENLGGSMIIIPAVILAAGLAVSSRLGCKEGALSEAVAWAGGLVGAYLLSIGTPKDAEAEVDAASIAALVATTGMAGTAWAAVLARGSPPPSRVDSDELHTSSCSHEEERTSIPASSAPARLHSTRSGSLSRLAAGNIISQSSTRTTSSHTTVTPRTVLAIALAVVAIRTLKMEPGTGLDAPLHAALVLNGNAILDRHSEIYDHSSNFNPLDASSEQASMALHQENLLRESESRRVLQESVDVEEEEHEEVEADGREDGNVDKAEDIDAQPLPIALSPEDTRRVHNRFAVLQVLQVLREEYLAALRRVLDLRRPVILFGRPRHWNLGDSFIWLGEKIALDILGAHVAFMCLDMECRGAFPAMQDIRSAAPTPPLSSAAGATTAISTGSTMNSSRSWWWRSPTPRYCSWPSLSTMSPTSSSSQTSRRTSATRTSASSYATRLLWTL